MVQAMHDEAQRSRTHGAKFGALGQILAQQAVGVFVGTALPGRTGMAEEESGMQGFGDELVCGELMTVVGGEGVDPATEEAQPTDAGAGQCQGALAREFREPDKTRAPLPNTVSSPRCGRGAHRRAGTHRSTPGRGIAPGSLSLFCTVVKTDKRHEDHPREVILKTFQLRPIYNYLCIVVDAGVDISNMDEVMWAYTTLGKVDQRITKVPASLSEATHRNHEDRAYGGHVGIDATMKLDERHEIERPVIPGCSELSLQELCHEQVVPATPSSSGHHNMETAHA